MGKTLENQGPEIFSSAVQLWCCTQCGNIIIIIVTITLIILIRLETHPEEKCFVWDLAGGVFTPRQSF